MQYLYPLSFHQGRGFDCHSLWNVLKVDSLAVVKDIALVFQVLLDGGNRIITVNDLTFH